MSARMLKLSRQHDARAAHGRRHVDLLHQLSARVMAKARDVAGCVFGLVANVEAVERPVCAASAVPDSFFHADAPNTGAIGDVAGIGVGALERPDRAAPLRRRVRASCLASVHPMVPLRSATTLLGTPALISDCVPMIERVRPAQFTTMVVSGFGAA